MRGPDSECLPTLGGSRSAANLGLALPVTNQRRVPAPRSLSPGRAALRGRRLSGGRAAGWEVICVVSAAEVAPAHLRAAALSSDTRAPELRASGVPYSLV